MNDKKSGGIYDEKGANSDIAEKGSGPHSEGRRRIGSPRFGRRFPSMAERRQGGSRYSRPELQNKEDILHKPNTGRADAAESGLTNQLGRGFTGSGAGADLAGAGRLIRLTNFLSAHRKKTAAGAIVGLLIAMLMFILSIGQGPLQVVHLSQILQKNFAGQEDASSLRFTALYRYAKTGDFGETRVGYFGSKNVAKTLQELKEIGIDFPERTSLGRIRTMSIDTSKENGFKGMTDEQIKSRLNFPDDGSANFRRQGSTVFIEVDPTTVKGIKYSKVLAGTGVASLENGRASTAMKTRVLKKFFGLPQLFSPISKRGAAAAEKLTSAAERRKAEEERAAPRIEANNSKFGSARASLQEKLSGKTGLFARGTLLGASALCTIRDAADDAETVNAGIRQAAAVEAIDKIASGAQGQSGIDVSLPQMGAIAESFINDKGESIWDSQPLDATAKGGRGKGKDIPGAFSQAFSKNSTARKIKDEIRMEIGGVNVTGAVCSDVGLVVQGAANIGLLVAAAPTGGASLAAYMAGQAASAAATTAISMLIMERVVDAISADESLVQVPPTGALGGSIMAFGAREAANISARSVGGVELSETETLVQDQKFEQKSQEEFRSKSFFARTFDLNDYRSLASRTINSTETDAKSNISNIASSLANAINIGSGLLPIFTAKASAQNEQPYYDWGSPRWGIPSRLLEDPDMEDPVENAKQVDAILKLNDDYIDRAKRCFGVEIGPGPYGLDAVATEEVDPNSDEYAEADCDHTDDPNWRRVILFVFDTRTVTAAMCYDGDEQSCKDLGLDGAAAGGGASESDASLVDGSAQELAKKLNGYKNEGKYVCDNPEDCRDIELMAQGESISCAKNPCGGAYQACHVDQLNKKVLQLIIYLIDSGYKIGTYALCRSHSDSGGVHDDGLAVDISSINGKSLGSGSGAKQLALEVDKIVFDFKGRLAAKQIITWGVGGVHYSEFSKYNRSAPGVEGGSVFDSGTLNGHMDHIHVGY